MTEEEFKQKLSVIISSETSGNDKLESLTELIDRETHLNMQYYMEYCEDNGYVTPMEWLKNKKHF